MLYGTRCSYSHTGKGLKVRAKAGAAGQFMMIAVVAIKKTESHHYDKRRRNRFRSTRQV